MPLPPSLEIETETASGPSIKSEETMNTDDLINKKYKEIHALEQAAKSTMEAIKGRHPSICPSELDRRDVEGYGKLKKRAVGLGEARRNLAHWAGWTD